MAANLNQSGYSMPIGVCGGGNTAECWCGAYRDRNSHRQVTYREFTNTLETRDNYPAICCGFCSQECQVWGAAVHVEVQPARANHREAAFEEAILDMQRYARFLAEVEADRIEEAAHFGGGAAAHVAAVPAVEDEMAAAIAASLATVNLDDDRRRDLAQRTHYNCNASNMCKNCISLMELLRNMPPFSAKFSEVTIFLPILNNLTGMNGKYMDDVRESSAAFLRRLQESAEFDGSFEGPQQKQEMVTLMQEFCKRL